MGLGTNPALPIQERTVGKTKRMPGPDHRDILICHYRLVRLTTAAGLGRRRQLRTTEMGELGEGDAPNNGGT